MKDLLWAMWNRLDPKTAWEEHNKKWKHRTTPSFTKVYSNSCQSMMNGVSQMLMKKYSSVDGDVNEENQKNESSKMEELVSFLQPKEYETDLNYVVEMINPALEWGPSYGTNEIVLKIDSQTNDIQVSFTLENKLGSYDNTIVEDDKEKGIIRLLRSKEKPFNQIHWIKTNQNKSNQKTQSSPKRKSQSPPQIVTPTQNQDNKDTCN